MFARCKSSTPKGKNPNPHNVHFFNATHVLGIGSTSLKGNKGYGCKPLWKPTLEWMHSRVVQKWQKL